MFSHSHIRHFSSVFVSLRDFELITQNSSENIASRQSRCIYVNGLLRLWRAKVRDTWQRATSQEDSTHREERPVTMCKLLSPTITIYA